MVFHLILFQCITENWIHKYINYEDNIMENQEQQQQPQQTIHPVAEGLIKFVNEALTLTECEARINLVKSVITDLEKGVDEFKEKQVQEEVSE